MTRRLPAARWVPVAGSRPGVALRWWACDRRSAEPRQAGNRRGVLLWVSMALIATLVIMAAMMAWLGRFNEVNAIFVYHSEVVTSLAEAAIEETFFNISKKLNDPSGNNRLYDMLRKHWDPERDNAPIDLDADTVGEFSAAARTVAKELYGIEGEKFGIKARITRIEPFAIRGMNPHDPIEKDAAFEVAVSITMGDLTKIVVASKPLKVVRTTVPVLAESTLFVNNDARQNLDNRKNPLTFAHWESAMGYDPKDFPKPSKTLTLDHGWAKFSRTNKKSDFIQKLEEEILPKGTVPPGRVYIREGIVPLTNGDRAAGALQKTFFSAESELLPVLPPIPLKSLKEGLREDYLESQDRAMREQLAREREGGTDLRGPGSGASGESTGPSDGSTGPSDASTSVPEEGDLIIRYLGTGIELLEEDMKKYLNGADGDGYRTYFGALADGPWKENPPSKSGLDLFGRTTEKEAGKAVEAEGFFARLWEKVKEIGATLLSKLYAQYNIRLSPTLVYGSVLQNYYMARDYAFTGWWENVKRTFGDKQIPIPYFPKDHLDRLPQEEPMKKEDLPPAWDDKLKDRFMKLPADIRKPSFIKTLDSWATRMNTALAPGLSETMQEEVANLPQGAIISPYHVALRSFLQTDPESKIDKWVGEYLKAGGSTPGAPGGGMFLSNEVDRAQQGIQGAYEPFFEGPLADFNPFLFYTKATEYISSLWDPRLPENAPPDQKNVFLRRFRDKDDPGLLRMNGVVYITGTEDLTLKNFRYTGKCTIITFGRVIFQGFLVKKQDSADDPKKNDLLTIIALGGIVFDTSEPVHAQLYSYIYPFHVTPGKTMNVFGGVGCNDLLLDHLGDGGQVNFDWTYHVPAEELYNPNSLDAQDYYHVSLTDEIDKFEYLIKRDAPEIEPGGAGP